MTIRTLLDQMAQTRGDAICLISPDEKRELRITDSQMQSEGADEMARLLADPETASGATPSSSSV